MKRPGEEFPGEWGGCQACIIARRVGPDNVVTGLLWGRKSEVYYVASHETAFTPELIVFTVFGSAMVLKP